MLLLVTDTSGKNGTVALARSGEGPNANEIRLLEVASLAGGMFSAQLVPQIAALLQKHGLSKTDIGGFIVVSGPGSFTGLRVGLAAIKALAEILQKPIVPVSLLELVATASLTGARLSLHSMAVAAKSSSERMKSQARFRFCGKNCCRKPSSCSLRENQRSPRRTLP